MKKWFGLAAAVCLAACASVNKNTVSYQMARFDQGKYYVVAGEGSDKNAAAKSALENMRADILRAVPQADTVKNVVPDLLANAKVEKVWRDKSSKQKNYFALAVLDRETAKNIVARPIDRVDGQLAGLAVQFAVSTDKFADLKIAFKMQPLIELGNTLADLYQFLDAGRGSYKAAELAQYKTLFKNKLAAIRVSVEVSGVQSEVLTTRVVDALNQMGLGVVSPDADRIAIAVKVKTEVDGYESEKVRGLVWCNSQAAVAMTDQETGATFARFSVHDRAGTSRKADSLRRSMEAVGEKSAEQIARRMDIYLRTR